MEEAFIFSEKVALREALGATALAFALGEVLRTLGAVFLLGVPGFLGAGERGCQSGEEELLLVRVSSPWPLGFMVQISAPHWKAILPFLPGKAAPAGSTIPTIVSSNIPTATSTPAAAAAASHPKEW